MHCYLCGTELGPEDRHWRRRVKTGEHTSTRYRGGKVSAVHTSYGMRVVCGQCVRFLDRQKLSRELIAHLVVLGLLALVVGYLLLTLKGDSSHR
jgi:hypothetical protein